MGNRLHIFISFRVFHCYQFFHSIFNIMIVIMHIVNKPQALKKWKSFHIIFYYFENRRKKSRRSLNSENELELNPVGWHCSEINTNCWFHYYYYLDLSTSRSVYEASVHIEHWTRFSGFLLLKLTVCFTLSPSSLTECPLIFSLPFSLVCFALLHFVSFALNLFICFQLLLLPENMLLYLHTSIHCMCTFYSFYLRAHTISGCRVQHASHRESTKPSRVYWSCLVFVKYITEQPQFNNKAATAKAAEKAAKKNMLWGTLQKVQQNRIKGMFCLSKCLPQQLAQAAAETAPLQFNSKKKKEKSFARIGEERECVVCLKRRRQWEVPCSMFNRPIQHSDSKNGDMVHAWYMCYNNK